MNRTQIFKCYTLAKLALSDANSNAPFAADKSQAMKDINFWRAQLNRSMQS